MEDDEASRRLLARLIRGAGHETSTAGTLAEGIAKLDGWRPECLILDLMLPDGPGTAILQRIRSEGLPVRVAVASGAHGPLLAQAQALAPDAFFPKPINVEQLTVWLGADDAL